MCACLESGYWAAAAMQWAELTKINCNLNSHTLLHKFQAFHKFLSSEKVNQTDSASAIFF